MRGRIGRTTVKRLLAAALVGALVLSGLRANGSIATDVAVNSGSVWLVDAPQGALVQVSALSRDVTAKVTVGAAHQQLVAVQVGHGAAVLNRSTGVIGLVDGTTLHYGRSRGLAVAGSDLQLVGNEAGLFAVDTAAGKLLALDPRTLAPGAEAPVSAQQRIATVVDDDGNLYAYDGERGELIRIERSSGRVLRSPVAAAGTVGALTLAGGRAVLTGAAGVVSQFDGKLEPTRVHRCEGFMSASSVLLAAGTSSAAPSAQSFVLDPMSGELHSVDLERGTCRVIALREGRRDAGESFGSPVVDGERVFVPDLSGARVLVVDTTHNRIERAIDLGFALPAGHRFELFLAGGRLWFNDLQGSKAGVLSPAGATLIVDKVAERSYSPAGVGGSDTAERAAGVGIVLAEGGLGLETVGGTGPSFGDGAGPDAGGDGQTSRSSSGDGNAASGDGRDTTGARVGAGPDGRGATSTTRPVVVPLDGPAAVGGSETSTSAAGAQIAVDDMPRASFTYSPPGDPTTETVVSFIDGSSGRIDRRVWTFASPDGRSAQFEGARLQRTLAQPGTWTVTLTVSNDSGANDTTAPMTIQVREPTESFPPQAGFGWEPVTPTVQAPVQFVDRSVANGSSPITSWFWEFGDGTTASGQRPAPKLYATAGVFVVRLTVRSDAGASSAEASVRVAAAPAALQPEFRWSVEGVVNGPIAAGQTVVFEDRSGGGPTTWSWDLGDGSTGSSSSVSHVYRTPGDVVVTLIVANALGSERLTRTLRIDPARRPPQAVISQPATGVTVEANTALLFVSASTGVPTSQVWDWGDGSAPYDGASASHTFTVPGAYVVTLTVSNAVGATSDAVLVNVVPEPPLLPSFSTDTGTSALDKAVVGEPVTFVNTSVGMGTFHWDFGDGSSSTERRPAHAYLREGTFRVVLTMTAAVRSAVAVGSVYVGPPPVPTIAAFDFSPANPTAGQAITFVDRTSGEPVRWTWSFGDGTPDARGAAPPAKVYTDPGSYDVVLRVVDRFGTVSSATATVVVNAAPRPAPEATFVVSPDPRTGLVTGRAITFTDTSPAPYPLSTPVFRFDAIPVSPAAGSRSVDHTFATPGDYTVSMTVCWADEPTNCTVGTMVVTVGAAQVAPDAAFDVAGPGVLPATVPPLLLVGQPVTFTDASTGTVTAWQWIVGADRVAARTLTVTPTVSGTLSVTLTVSNDAGSSTVTLELSVLDAVPSAAFTVGATGVAVGDVVTFGDVAPAGATRTWNFGDGTAAVTTTEATVQHVFVSPGTFVVQLTVAINGYVTSSTSTVQVTETPPAPVVGVTELGTGTPLKDASPSVPVGATLLFERLDAGAAGGATQWSWSDGVAGGSGASITRTFDAEGTYTLTLVATNSAGTSSVAVTVFVTAPVPV